MNSQRKTDRVYGLAFRAIRELAAIGRPFTAHDVPNHTKHTHKHLHQLARGGELLVLIKGKPVPGGPLTVFQATPNLRTP